MQVNNFIQYLDNPKQLKAVSENEMLPIIKEFPYCQTGQLMYAIQLNENNSILFDEQLKKTASICSDRNKLFEYIHHSNEAEVPVKVNVANDILTEVSAPELQLENSIEVVVQNKEELTQVKRDDDLKETIPEKNSIEKDQLVNIEKEEVIITPTSENVVSLDDMNSLELVEPENEIVEIENNSTTLKADKTDSTLVNDELAILEKQYLSQAIHSNLLLNSKETSQKVDETDNDEVEKQINLFDETNSHSFSSWLKHYTEEEKEALFKSNKDKSQDSKNDKDVLVENIKEKKQNLIDKVIKENPRIKNENLIDKFVQEDATKKPEMAEFYSPVNMARLSDTDDGFVSETLALIHVDQRNFQEAINTYNKLILKSPKKKSYFASQIKILKQKIK